MGPHPAKGLLEGYLPSNDFVTALMSSLGRIGFVQNKYRDAQRWYGRCSHRLCRFPLCTSGDVLVGDVTVQCDPRSHSAGQNRRGTSQQVPVQPVGVQSDSVHDDVAALLKEGSRRHSTPLRRQGALWIYRQQSCSRNGSRKIGHATSLADPVFPAVRFNSIYHVFPHEKPHF